MIMVLIGFIRWKEFNDGGFFYKHAGKNRLGWFRLFRGCLFRDFFNLFFCFFGSFWYVGVKNIFWKIKKNIIFMYFKVKNILKINHYHITLIRLFFVFFRVILGCFEVVKWFLKVFMVFLSCFQVQMTWNLSF